MKLEQLAENLNMDYVIAIDMDGVLADFEGKVEEIFGKPMSEIPKKEVWNKITWYNKNVEKFFENLPIMNDAMDLISFIINNFDNYYILTASGHTPTDVKEQKIAWINKVLGPQYKVNIVRKSSDKAQFATKNSILIDDRTKSTEPWAAAGGIAILHKNTADTIEKLKEILKNETTNA